MLKAHMDFGGINASKKQTDAPESASV